MLTVEITVAQPAKKATASLAGDQRVQAFSGELLFQPAVEGLPEGILPEAVPGEEDNPLHRRMLVARERCRSVEGLWKLVNISNASARQEMEADAEVAPLPPSPTNESAPEGAGDK